MRFYQCLLWCCALQATQLASTHDVDASEINGVADYQTALDSYYKKIRSIQAKYNQIQVKNHDSAMAQDIIAFVEKERIATANKKKKTTLNTLTPPPLLEHHEDASIRYEYSEQFPFMIQTKISQLSIGTENKIEFITKALANGKQYQLSSHAHNLIETTKIDLNVFDRSIFNGMGKRIFRSVNQPLSDLLKSPDSTILQITKDEVMIKTGPNFSESIRPSGLPVGAFVVIHLQKQFPHLPTKFVIDLNSLKKSDPKLWPNDDFAEVYEISDYRPTTLIDSGEKILFPYQYKFHALTEDTHWTITDLILNASIATSSFIPTAPPGYSVTKGEKANVKIIQGGSKSRDLVARQTAEEARKLLARGVPVSDNQYYGWTRYLTIASCGVVGFVAILLLRHRN